MNESRSVVSDSLRPMGCTVHGILQARILEWVAVPFSRGSSQPRDQPQVFHIARWILYQLSHQGFPGSSVGKEPACKAGDPGWIPGSGRSAGEGIGYSPWYSWASPGGSAGKESTCNAKTWVRFLGWEDPLEKGTATHSSILAWRIAW